MNFSTDSDLIKRLPFIDSFDRSWHVFLSMYEPLILRWCLRWGVPSMEAEDIVQETMLNIFRYIGSYRQHPQIRFRSWLKTVAYHCWIRIVKRNQGLSETDAELAYDIAKVPARDDLLQILSTIADQEIVAIACGNVRSKVSDRSWNCFQMKYMEAIPTTEVAGRLHVSENAVYLTTSRILRMLREEIAKLDPD
jgi:RNA polymerase sigma factor (sigma-70 family)